MVYAAVGKVPGKTVIDDNSNNLDILMNSIGSNPTSNTAERNMRMWACRTSKNLLVL